MFTFRCLNELDASEGTVTLLDGIFSSEADDSLPSFEEQGEL
jgi:hypothetical protein